MATSLLSLALNHPLDPTIAMTGELTVTGKVLRIGGLREKTVAARRAGAKAIIFPADNMSDWLELPEVRVDRLSHVRRRFLLTILCRISKMASKATLSAGTPMCLISSLRTWTGRRQTTPGRSNSPNLLMSTSTRSVMMKKSNLPSS